ncbi:MAG: hypothetical protein ACI9CQ_002229 [Saprospiraceae bacterium]|jgi:hypothetical protein
MKKNTDKNTDNIFKKHFENFQVPPPKAKWEEIEGGMDSDMDQEFRERLQPLQITPQAKIWENIQEELPLHPKARRYISWMTKIAAILVIGMLLSILSDQHKQEEIALSDNNSEQTILSLELNKSNNPTDDFLRESENTAFVFEVKKRSHSRKYYQKYSKEEEAEMKKLLRFILDDDEDLANMSDPEVINESLKPIEALKGEMALAKIDVEAPEQADLRIRIPLIIVETEQEAADLIQLYESSHAPLNRVD